MGLERNIAAIDVTPRELVSPTTRQTAHAREFARAWLISMWDNAGHRGDRPMYRTVLALMKSQMAFAVVCGCAAAVVYAQGPSSSFPRGSSMQNWQNPGLKNVLAKCKN